MDEKLREVLMLAQRALAAGESPEAVNEAIKQETGLPSLAALRQAVEETSVTPRNLGRSLAQGATFGFADELAGLGGAIMGKGYTETRDESRRRNAAFSEAHPWIAGGAELAGGLLVPGLGAERALAKGAGSVGRAALQGLKVGTGAGALAGLGYAEGDAGDQLRGAALGGVVGGAGGALLGGGMAALRGGANMLPGARARRMAQKAVADVGGEEAAIARARNFETQGRGEQALFADLGDPMREVADYAATRSPEVRGPLAREATSRTVTSPVRVLDDVTGGIAAELGDNPIAAQRIEELAQKRLVWADEAYRALERENPHIANVEQVTAFLSEPRTLRTWEDAMRAGMVGELPTGPLSFETLNRTRRSLDGAVGRAYKLGDVPLAQRISGVRDGLEDLLMQGVPEFGAVQSEYASRVAMEKAIEAGTKAWNQSDSRLLRRTMAALPSDAHRQAFRYGMASELIAGLRSGQGQTRAAMKLAAAREAGDVALNDKLRVVFGSEKTFNRIMDRVEAEAELLRLSRATGGSDTARRLMQTGLDPAEIMDPMAQTLIEGPVRGGVNATRRGTKAIGGRMERATARELGPMLQTRGVGDIIRLIRELQQNNRLIYPMRPAAQVGLGNYLGGAVGSQF